MRTLPATIGELPKLQSLFLNNNMLLSVPDETGNCVSLEMVNFRGNRKLQVHLLTRFFLYFSGLPSLTTIWVLPTLSSRIFP